MNHTVIYVSKSTIFYFILVNVIDNQFLLEKKELKNAGFYSITNEEALNKILNCIVKIIEKKERKIFNCFFDASKISVNSSITSSSNQFFPTSIKNIKEMSLIESTNPESEVEVEAEAHPEKEENNDLMMTSTLDFYNSELIKTVETEITKENKAFNYSIEEIKQTLDVLTDVIENDDLLRLEKIEELITFLDKNKNFIASNIE